MYIYKNLGFRGVWYFSWMHIMWITIYMTTIALLHHFLNVPWLAIPWLPVSLIGTAVAFYVGFKNNQSYDRLWEARKIWGAIVNSSRSWGAGTIAYVSNLHAERPASDYDLSKAHQRLIYRHIAWLYTLRRQLLVPTSWEHINQNKSVRQLTERRMANLKKQFPNDEEVQQWVQKLLPEEEFAALGQHKNAATQLIKQQAIELAKLRQAGLIDDFRHMELQKLLDEFYVHQGKAERIKKFPLPRQYGSMSLIFVSLFIFLLPFGIIPTFAELGPIGFWLSIPFAGLVAWVFLMMELVGDYSENPFEGLGNDIPMLNLSRVIEIDLRQMLGETDLPPAITAKGRVLM